MSTQSLPGGRQERKIWALPMLLVKMTSMS
jgi:hypothetical protein